MRIYQKILIGSAIALAITTGIFLIYSHTIQQVNAGALDNVWGFAWSDLMGWVSFNSTSGGGSNSYGVNITDSGTTGVFSGYAWSSNAGWLTFNEASLAGCPSAPCRAWVDKTTGLVYGWAKILTTGDWVRLRGNGCNVSISKAVGTEGDFLGWAWGGETIGWLSFNCNQAETGDICPSANYKVETSFDMNNKPTVAVASPPNPAPVNLCTTPAYNFSWVFSDLDAGDTQSQYQLQVDKEGTFASFGAGEVDITAVSSAQSKEILLAKNPGPNQLGYNTVYFWRVRVWDNHPNGVSAWAYGNNFTTPQHIYPTPDFTWKPASPIKDQLIRFCSVLDLEESCLVDVSECYDASNNKVSCLGRANFSWTLPANAEFASSTDASTPNPVIKFTTSGKNQAISLQITDNVGTCSVSKNVNVTLPLPKWKEILPQ